MSKIRNEAVGTMMANGPTPLAMVKEQEWPWSSGARRAVSGRMVPVMCQVQDNI